MQMIFSTERYEKTIVFGEDEKKADGVVVSYFKVLSNTFSVKESGWSGRVLFQGTVQHILHKRLRETTNPISQDGKVQTQTEYISNARFNTSPIYQLAPYPTRRWNRVVPDKLTVLNLTKTRAVFPSLFPRRNP
jgi:hypothetical protein